MNSDMASDIKLPRMRMVYQRFNVPPPVDVLSEVDREWSRLKDRFDLAPGFSVAMGVGSLGITNLDVVGVQDP